MAPDDEQQRAWREPVRVFRLAANVLEDPASSLLADLSVEDGVSGLTQELPLVSFSPFNPLSGAVLAGSDERPPVPGGGSGRASHPAAGRRPTPTGISLPQTFAPPGGPRSLREAATQDSQHAVGPPVFSFRRGRPDAAQARSSQGDRDAREGSMKEGEETPHAGHFRIQGPAPGDRRAETRNAAHARLDSPTAIHVGAVEDHTARPDQGSPVRGSDGLSLREASVTERGIDPLPGPHREAHAGSAIALIESLLEHLPTPEARTAEHLRGSDEYDSGVAGSNAPATTNGREFEVNRGDKGSAVGLRPPIPPMTLLDNLAEGVLERLGRAPDAPALPLSVPSRSVPMGGRAPRSQKPGSETRGGNAVTSVDSLAQHLLASEARNDGATRSVPAYAGDRSREGTAPDLPALAFPDGADGVTIGRFASGSNRPDRYSEAQTVATLVNDVLVEQARRHGVDLS